MQIILKREFDEDLKKDWCQLEKKNNLIIFQTYKWNENWIKFNKIEYMVMIFIVYDNNEPIAIFPFYKQKKFFFNILRWIGNDVSDYPGPIIDSNYFRKNFFFDNIWKEIILKIKFECDLIYLDKQTDHKTLFNNPLKNFLKCTKYGVNYGINLSGWETILKDKNKSIQQYRSKKKKLSSLGNFEFIYNVNNLIDKKNLISDMIKWKKKNKKKQIFINTFVDEYYFNFLNHDNILISALKLDGKFIAGILGYKLNNNYYFLLPSYKVEDKTFKLSPGRILLIDLINFLYEKKFNFFNFCDGNQQYKKEWSNEKINLSVYLKSNTIKGYLLKLFLKLKLHK